MEVVDVHLVLSDVVAKFIRSAEGDAGLSAAAGHPHGEAVRMVVGSPGFITYLIDGRATKLSTPDDEGVFEQAALFEVGDGLIGSLALAAVLATHIGM